MFTTSIKNKIMNAMFGNVPYTFPTSFSVGLSTTTPTSSGGNIKEPAASTGYQRVSLPLFGAASNGAVANVEEIEFPVFTSDAGTATHYVLYDQNNKVFWFDELKVARRLEADTMLIFAAGALRITLNDAV